jgi:hypothetical protein
MSWGISGNIPQKVILTVQGLGGRSKDGTKPQEEMNLHC